MSIKTALKASGKGAFLEKQGLAKDIARLNEQQQEEIKVIIQWLLDYKKELLTEKVLFKLIGLAESTNRNIFHPVFDDLPKLAPTDLGSSIAAVSTVLWLLKESGKLELLDEKNLLSLLNLEEKDALQLGECIWYLHQMNKDELLTTKIFFDLLKMTYQGKKHFARCLKILKEKDKQDVINHEQELIQLIALDERLEDLESVIIALDAAGKIDFIAAKLFPAVIRLPTQIIKAVGSCMASLEDTGRAELVSVPFLLGLINLAESADLDHTAQAIKGYLESLQNGQDLVDKKAAAGLEKTTASQSSQAPAEPCSGYFSSFKTTGIHQLSEGCYASLRDKEQEHKEDSFKDKKPNRVS